MNGHYRGLVHDPLKHLNTHNSPKKWVDVLSFLRSVHLDSFGGQGIQGSIRCYAM